MKKLSIVALNVLFLFATGCSTIYFDRTPAKPESFKKSDWRANIIRLIEIGDPTDMSDRCKGRNWGSIEVKQTFVQGLISGVTYGIYDPWNVAYICTKAAGTKSK